MKKNTAPTETATARYLPGEEIAVLLPLPLAGTYDYRVAEEMTLTAGDFINVPLGARKAIGVVWGKGEGGVPESKLKDVLGRLDCPPLPEVSRDFVDWTARYTLSAPGAVLKMVMSVPEALTPPKPVIAYTLNPKPEPFKPTKARELVESFDADEGIPSRRFFHFSILALVLFVVCLAGLDQLPWGLNNLGMGFVALTFAGIVLLAYKHEVDKFYKAVDWDLLAFFAGLFVVINTMEHAGVLAVMGQGIERLTGLGEVFGSGLLLIAAAIASAVTDNIPLAAMLARILDDLNTPASSPYWWCVILGANLGGNITPIGS
ncbi:MAG TPA: hypothetical protein EYO85_04825, partial [Rhodospirillales bacterium]|nr:hypothetical protein [Rhodospirillales bacterium]